jgi:hypothetical protein
MEQMRENYATISEEIEGLDSKIEVCIDSLTMYYTIHVVLWYVI